MHTHVYTHIHLLYTLQYPYAHTHIHTSRYASRSLKSGPKTRITPISDWKWRSRGREKYIYPRAQSNAIKSAKYVLGDSRCAVRCECRRVCGATSGNLRKVLTCATLGDHFHRHQRATQPLHRGCNVRMIGVIRTVVHNFVWKMGFILGVLLYGNWEFITEIIVVQLLCFHVIVMAQISVFFQCVNNKGYCLHFGIICFEIKFPSEWNNIDQWELIFFSILYLLCIQY